MVPCFQPAPTMPLMMRGSPPPSNPMPDGGFQPPDQPFSGDNFLARNPSVEETVVRALAPLHESLQRIEAVLADLSQNQRCTNAVKEVLPPFEAGQGSKAGLINSAFNSEHGVFEADSIGLKVQNEEINEERIRAFCSESIFEDVEDMHAGHWHMKTIQCIFSNYDRLKRWAKPSKNIGPYRRRLIQLVESLPFERLCSAIILVNTVSVAYMSDWEMKNIGRGQTITMDVFELLFTAWYTVELLTRLAAYRLSFFLNADARWHWFDLSMVALAISDQYAKYLARDSTSNLSFMRMFRLLKLTKILRTLRVMRVFRDLQQMIESFAHSITALFWSFVMIVFVMYVFALIFVQAMTGYLTDNQGNVGAYEYREIKNKFGSLVMSMLSMYMSATGGYDWSITYNLVRKAGVLYGAFYIWFTFFFAFALMNVLTGVIVEKALFAATPDREEVILQQRRTTVAQAAQFRQICLALDSNHNGFISRDEFMKHMQDDLMRTFLAAKQLEVRDATMFFDMVRDVSDVEEVSIDKFVEGCMAMKGYASSIDMQRQLFASRDNKRAIRRMEQECLSKFDQILAKLS